MSVVATNVDLSWVPVAGRHTVNIGSSLGRALKARKGAPATKATKIPERDFYSLRYNFKPPSIDPVKIGSIDVKKGKEHTSVTVEHPSSTPGEAHLFVGSEQPAKDVECVLIYDEDTGTFTLEKMDSFMSLTYEKRTAATLNLPFASASPQPPPQSVDKPNPNFYSEAQLSHHGQILKDDSDKAFEEILPKMSSNRPPPPSTVMREEEEEIFIPPASARAPSPPKPVKPATAKQAKAQPKPKASQPKQAKAPPKGKGKVKRDASLALPSSNSGVALPSSSSITVLPAPEPLPPSQLQNIDDAEIEDLQFGQPAQWAVPKPPSRSLDGLALPGLTSISAPYLPPPASKTGSGLDSDSDDGGWDAVPVEPSAQGGAPVLDITPEDDGKDIDMDAFAAEMNEELEEGEEDNFLAAAFAGGDGGAEQILPSDDEDDYSSSEESEDD